MAAMTFTATDDDLLPSDKSKIVKPSLVSAAITAFWPVIGVKPKGLLPFFGGVIGINVSEREPFE